jgi:hypothetical protein
VTSISKAVFAQQANAICKGVQKRFDKQSLAIAQGVQASGGSETKWLKSVSEQALAPAIETETSELRELGAPANATKKVEAVLVALEDVRSEMQQDPVGFWVKGKNEPWSEAQGLAQKAGISACGWFY